MPGDSLVAVDLEISVDVEGEQVVIVTVTGDRREEYPLTAETAERLGFMLLRCARTLQHPRRMADGE